MTSSQTNRVLHCRFSQIDTQTIVNHWKQIFESDMLSNWKWNVNIYDRISAFFSFSAECTWKSVINLIHTWLAVCGRSIEYIAYSSSSVRMYSKSCDYLKKLFCTNFIAKRTTYAFIICAFHFFLCRKCNNFFIRWVPWSRLWISAVIFFLSLSFLLWDFISFTIYVMCTMKIYCFVSFRK